MHTNLKNNKKYIGITSRNPEERWHDGKGYIQNDKFFSDIMRYGWNNFSHDILYDNLSHREAIDLEREYIEKYDLINNGYNISPGQFNELDYDYYDFPIFNETNYTFSGKDNRFSMIPNQFIRTNLKKTYSLSRVFLVVYFWIGRNRTLEDRSHLVINDVVESIGYKIGKTKPKVCYEIRKSIAFLRDNNYINYDIDVKTVKDKECINIEIITENFDPISNYTRLFFSEYDSIMSSQCSVEKVNLLLVYLYVKSHIFERKRDSDNKEVYRHPKQYPESYYKGIDKLTDDLSMARKTAINCLNTLSDTTGDCNLLIKGEPKYMSSFKDYAMNNVPNIYVLNHEGYNQEIDWTIEKFKNFFKPNFVD